MLVLVTGGAGYVGAHSVAAILRAGHAVRVLTRDPAHAADALRAVSVAPQRVEVVTGDVTDAASVRSAVRGCDAVLHAAGVYSFDTRDRGAMRATNAHGTDVVLTAARSAGADPIVHVSTFGVLRPGPGGPVGPAAAVTGARETYLATKAEAEHIARRHQQEGAPVVVTYPLAALGPGHGRLGDQLARVRNTLRGLMPLWPAGGFPIGDVRDVAWLHAAVLRPGLGPRRFVGPGRYVTTREYVETLRRVTGRKLPAAFLPAAMMLPVGLATGALQRIVPVHLPAEYGAIYVCAVARPVDTGATDELLGTPGRSLTETMTDTVGWLHAAGRLSRRQAGLAAGAAAVLQRR